MLQGVNDLDLPEFTEGGVNIIGLRLVDVLNKTVRDFILERQSRRPDQTRPGHNARRILVFFFVSSFLSSFV